jgi:hypothetical protein
MTTHGAGMNALDEFLPESVFTQEAPTIRGVLRGGIELYVAPAEIQLDAMDVIAPSAAPTNSSAVQAWPMLAAALVAIGVSMIAMAAFARFGFTTL